MKPFAIIAACLLAHPGFSGAAPSQEIDALVASDLKANGIEASEPASEAEFLRRTYLGIAGRIPTAEESRSFLDSKAPDKRAQLIDRLLDSDGFVSHQFNYWADILRAQTRLQGIRGNAGDPYILYLKNSLRTNKPYDDLVRELITASGDTWDSEAGATGFYRRDKGMPLDHMALTVQVFLGTQLACAQCHDHPFDDWTQKDFYQMAAFTSMPSFQLRNGVSVEITDKSADLRRVQMHLRRQSAGENDTASRAIGQILRDTLGFGIPDAGTGTIRLPKDYQYDDAKPGDVLRAKTLFGKEVPYDSTWNSRTRDTGSPDSREAFAEWMVSPENPRFTKVIVNRLWKRVMGRGLVEPVDDFRDDTKPSNPELLAYLEKTMVALDYDLKAFFRVLYNTRAYQRKANGEDLDPGVAYHFEGPLLHRMTAEQLWDSLLTLKLADVDAYKNPHDTGIQHAAYAKLDAMDAPEMITFIDGILDELKGGNNNIGQVYAAFAKKVGAGDAYQQMAGGQGGRMMEVAGELSPEQRQVFLQRGPELRRLFEEGKRAREDGDTLRAREIFVKAQTLRKEMGLDPEKMRRLAQQAGGGTPGRRGRGGPQFVRASEMVSPAPPGHFLREFGSADREAVENASLEATTPQALELLNGIVDETLLADREARLMKGLDAAGDSPPKKIEFLYLSIWSRYPQQKEIDYLSGYVRDTKEGDAFHDIIWSMLNSHEFRFIQ
jgi:hypothetical protein